MMVLKSLFKFYYFIILVIFLSFGFLSKSEAANEGSECTAGQASSGNCYITPTEIALNVKGIWYCYGEPAAPTSVYSNPAQGLGNENVKKNPGNVLKQVNGKGCSRRIFNGSNDISINEGVSSGLTNALGAGRTQTFEWIVLQISPTIGMKASFTFSNTKTTSAVKYPTPTDPTPSVMIGGKICNTKGGTFMTENGGQNTINCTTDSSVIAGLNNYVFNRLGTQNFFSWILSNGQTAKAWLTDSNNKLQNGLTSSEVTTLQSQVASSETDPFDVAYNALENPATSILVAFRNPFTWYKCRNRQKGTRRINLNWYVTNALRVEFSSATNINLVSPSAFDMFLEAPLKARGSC